MARIDEQSPPQSVRSKPEGYWTCYLVVTGLSERAYYIHEDDIGKPLRTPLSHPAFITRPTGGARGVFYLADATERKAIATDRDIACRAHWSADRQGWGIPV